MPRTLRAFFAIELPAAVREAIAERVTALAREVPDGVRWTASENYHVTLKFLGEIAEDRVPQLLRGAAGRLARSARFDAELGGFGAFPGARAANIVWVGVAQGAGPLAKLARKLEAAASAIDVPREPRPFQAHVTVGRLREPRALPIERFMAPLGAGFPVAEVVLLESRLAPTGPQYVPCARLPLSDTDAGDAREFDELAPEI